MASAAWIGSQATGLSTWIQERPGQLIRLSISRRLHFAQIAGALLGGPGFLLFLAKIHFWSNPEHPLFIKVLVATVPLAFCLGLWGLFRPPYLEFDFAKAELRLYLFPTLQQRIPFAQAAALLLQDVRRDHEMSKGVTAVTINAQLSQKLKDGEILGLVEDWNRRRLYTLAEELARRLNIPFDPGHYYENSHLKIGLSKRRRNK